MGAPIPRDKYAGQTGGFIDVSEIGGIEVIVIFDNVNEAEITFWQNMEIEYGLFVEDGIPFFVGLFAGSIYLESPFNIRGVSSVSTEEWISNLNEQGTVFLVDNELFELKMIRMFKIEANFISRLKDALSKQMDLYLTAREIKNKIDLIQAKYPTSKTIFELLSKKYSCLKLI
ncbi:hypothetical protein PV783_14105 [Chitinophaga sp. CC14]|uniref:hypothetical protein n=1 Tax=Chitinophaga sp. CC14 TaxID=3029199 RepID=UPI003B81C7AB